MTTAPVFTSVKTVSRSPNTVRYTPGQGHPGGPGVVITEMRRKGTKYVLDVDFIKKAPSFIGQA